jgi:MOSC domain-containing protein YiiM
MATDSRTPKIHALARSDAYTFTKVVRPALRLLEGLGVEDDVHCGATVKHRSRVAADPTQPNLRQVHLLQRELFEELATNGFEVAAGDLGENITTAGIDLLSLPTGTVLTLGMGVRIELTGLRNPCGQINGFRDGLLSQVRTRDDRGEIIRRAGVMAIVLSGGDIETGDPIEVERPAEPHRALECV